MDEIRIKELEVYAHHGVYPEENSLGQKFLVSAVLYTDTRKAGLTDDLDSSTNYAEVCRTICYAMTEQTYQLIEKAAEEVARKILLTYPLILAVDVEIQKPWAPIGLPVNTVSVKIHRKWNSVYIALGSNMGDRKGYLDMAVARLKEDLSCRVIHVADYLETEPYGVTDQDAFLNSAMHLETLYTPHELLEKLHEIEQQAKRERTRRWGPRTLDLDILLFDDVVMEDEDLTIPHADMENRTFVLGPLAQIAPSVRHPVYGTTIRQMLNALLKKEKEDAV